MLDLSIHFPSMAALVGMCIIVFCASVVQASLGMGYGLTAAPLLAVVDPVFVPVATIMIGMISSTMGAISEFDKILWPDVHKAVIGRVAGSAGAVWLMTLLVDKNAFMVLFGVAIAAAVLLSAFGHSMQKTTRSLCAMGSISGLMGTITGVGAPPLALLYQGSFAGQARPTLAAIFAFGCGTSLVFLGGVGWVGTQELVTAVLMLPPMLAGTLAGRQLRTRFDRRYRVALLMLAAGAALLLIARGVFGLTWQV